MNNDADRIKIYRVFQDAEDFLFLGEDPQHFFERICKILVHSGLMAQVWVSREQSGKCQQLLATAGTLNSLEMTRFLEWISEPGNPLKTVLIQNRQISVNQLTKALVGTAWLGHVKASHWDSVLLVPVNRLETPWGEVGFVSTDQRFFDDEIASLAQKLVRKIEMFLDKAALTRRIRHLDHRSRLVLESDVISGVSNRTALEEYFNRLENQLTIDHSDYAVVMIDIDDFKSINERVGFSGGDAFLKQFTKRLHTIWDDASFVAHLGGDEFVVVFESQETSVFENYIADTMERLYQSMQTPFIVHGESFKVSISAGVSISHNGEHPDSRLREADVALYESKHRDHHGCWWINSTQMTDLQPSALIIDPFSQFAQNLLDRYATVIDEVAGEFAVSFYSYLRNDPKARLILDAYNEYELESLYQRQAEHLRFISKTGTSEEQIHLQGMEIGRIHGLVGVEESMLLQASTLYRQLLARHLEEFVGRSGWDILSVISARLDLDIRAELAAIHALHEHYYQIIESDLDNQTTTRDRLKNFLNQLANLPGVKAALFMIPDTDGKFYVIEGAGTIVEDLILLFDDPTYRVSTDARLPQGRGPGGRAWRSLTIQVIDNQENDKGLMHWVGREKRLGVRSQLVIPIRDQNGHASANFALYGAYPHQFSEGESLYGWGKRLQNRLESLWQALRLPAQSVALNQGESIRERLFSGGFVPFFQPIVNLKNGCLVKIESLARLRTEEGGIIAPGTFLPLLGNNELYRLFWLSLEKSLEFLMVASLSSEVQLSVNLPPSCLLEPDLLDRLRGILNAYPGMRYRLIFELLETEEIHRTRQHDILEKLKGMGIKLALDDLGAGYGSLLRLIREPLDVLKIDQNLVRRLPEDPWPTLTLLWTLINLAQNLSREIVVEGLEGRGLIEALQWMDASLGQGFAIARPMPGKELEMWVHSFQLSTDIGVVTTYTGALACLWKHYHEDHPRSYVDYKNCPMTQFFKTIGKEQSPPGRWHRYLHDEHIEKEVYEKDAERLRQWLIKKVKKENDFITSDENNQLVNDKKRPFISSDS